MHIDAIEPTDRKKLNFRKSKVVMLEKSKNCCSEDITSLPDICHDDAEWAPPRQAVLLKCVLC